MWNLCLNITLKEYGAGYVDFKIVFIPEKSNLTHFSPKNLQPEYPEFVILLL